MECDGAFTVNLECDKFLVMNISLILTKKKTCLFHARIQTFHSVRKSKAAVKSRRKRDKKKTWQVDCVQTQSHEKFCNLETTIKLLKPGVSSNTSIIFLLETLGGFGGGPPPVFFDSLLNSENSFFRGTVKVFPLVLHLGHHTVCCSHCINSSPNFFPDFLFLFFGDILCWF